MNSKEIQKLNANLEKVNENFAKLFELLANKSNPVIAMVSSPEVSEMIGTLNLAEVDMGGMIIPLNSSSMREKGLDVSVAQGVNVVKILKHHTEYSSTCFNEIHYNPKAKKLTVFFIGNREKKGYTYANINQDTYREFIMANSLGRFYLNNIKGNANYPVVQK